MGQSPRRPAATLARAAVAVLVALTVTACGTEKAAAPPPSPSIEATPTDPPVEVIGLPDGAELEVTDTIAGVENGEFLTFVSPVYGLGPRGSLGNPVTVRLKLDNALPPGYPVVVATRDAFGEPWDYAPAKLTEDQRHVEYTTTELSEVGALSVDRAGALAALQRDFAAGYASGLDRSVRKPTCAGEAEARKSGYTVAASKTKTVFWCFGLDGDRRVLKVVNRRTTPVEIAHPGVDVLEQPASVQAWKHWVRVLDAKNTFVPPQGSTTYDADLVPETELLLTAQSTPTAQSLRVLQAAVRAIVLRLVAFDLGKANVVETVKALAARPQCARTFTRANSDALLAGCLSPIKLNQTFGSRAELVAPLVTSPAFVTAVRQASMLTAERAGTTDRQRIVVRRAAPDFSSFTGFWAGRARLLAINGEGLATETISDELGKPIIALSYQLEDPESDDNGASLALATVTKVKVTQRKLVPGTPPRVGAQGVVRLSDGVVKPPFLAPNYCDEASAKKGGCGVEQPAPATKPKGKGKPKPRNG